MAEREDHRMEQVTPEREPARKPYTAPKLRVYGDVSTITRTIGRKGTVADGGHGSMSKTS